jgi:chorismate-pyruvate lyase
MSAIEMLENIPGIDVAKLAPLQRVLLITDGTLTEILEAYLLEPIELVKLSEKLLKSSEVSARLDIEEGERVMERKINLRGAKSGVLHVYAESLILVDRLAPSFQAELLETDIPLGRLWRSYRLETYKQLVSVACQPARELGAHLGCAENAPVLGRVYDVFSAGRLVMRIAENFCAGSPCVPAQSATMR